MAKINTLNYQTVAAWNGSQDLFVVEQADGTKVATPEQIKQYVLGNTIDDIYSVMGHNGAKNLIPYPYKETTKEDHGVTFTVNNDGTVVANGTANGTAQLYLVLGDVALSAAGNLVINTNKPLFLSGCPSGGSHSTFRIQYGLTDGTTYWAKTASDIGSGVKITPVDGLNSYCFVVIKIMVFNGTTVSNLTFKPMLRLASDTDNTYQPYAKTNKQLTDELDTAREQIANLTSNALDNPIDIKNYTSSNRYQVPKDGYIRYRVRSGESGGCTIYGSNQSSSGYLFGYIITAAHDTREIIFVKKGMYVQNDGAYALDYVGLS